MLSFDIPWNIRNILKPLYISLHLFTSLYISLHLFTILLIFTVVRLSFKDLHAFGRISVPSVSHGVLPTACAERPSGCSQRCRRKTHTVACAAERSPARARTRVHNIASRGRNVKQKDSCAASPQSPHADSGAHISPWAGQHLFKSIGTSLVQRAWHQPKIITTTTTRRLNARNLFQNHTL